MTPSSLLTVGKLCVICVVATMTADVTQQQRFEATVSRVRVDVIVQDNDGAFVDDLTADDFRIFEDGGEQAILSVQMIDLAAGVLFDRTRSAVTSVPTDLVANSDPSSGTPSERCGDFGAILFVVDFQNLDFRNKLRFTQAWEDLIAQTDGLQIPRAVYLLDRDRDLFLLDALPLPDLGAGVGGSVLARDDRVYVVGRETIWVLEVRR